MELFCISEAITSIEQAHDQLTLHSPRWLGSQQEHPSCFYSFLFQTGRGGPASSFQTFQGKVEMFPNLPSFASAGSDCFSPLLAVWGCQWTSQGAETWWHSKVASSREEGDSTPGWSFCRKSLGSVCVWLRRLAHFREKLQSPCKNFLKNAQIENILEGQNTWV